MLEAVLISIGVPAIAFHLFLENICKRYVIRKVELREFQEWSFVGYEFSLMSIIIVESQF